MLDIFSCCWEVKKDLWESHFEEANLKEDEAIITYDDSIYTDKKNCVLIQLFKKCVGQNENR